MPTVSERLRSALAPGHQVRHEIGSGGMGQVFLAYNPGLNRLEAIKVIKPGLATASAVERFRREARILASIDHPNIVAVYGAGEADGLFYYVMAYLRGEPLSARLERGSMQLAEVVRLASDVLNALDAAHARGVIHRDLKPANVFLENGRAKVVDFGVAKDAFAAEDSATTGDWPPGTPGYMAPEQWSGGTVTPRTDIYAAGAVLYEALTGKQWRLTEPNWSHVPAAVVPVLQRALALSPADRWPDAAAFRDEFIAAATTVVPAEPDSRPPGLMAVMFVDMVGYTTVVHDDIEAARRARKLIRDAVEAALTKHDGEVLQYLGDGCLSIFRSVVEAVFAAFDVQGSLRVNGIEIRVGIDHGEITFDKHGVVGDAVNVASRILSVAPAGAVAVSEKVFAEIQNRRTIGTTFLATYPLKNVARPVAIYVVAPAMERPEPPDPPTFWERVVHTVATIMKEMAAAMPRLLRAYRFGFTLALIVVLFLVVPRFFRPLRVVAVVPQYAAASGDADKYISRGLADGIQNQLRRRTDLPVISNEVFGESMTDARAIGRARQLDVDALVLIRASADDSVVQINAQLVRVRTGVTIWDTLPRVRRDNLAVLVDELSPALASALKIPPPPPPRGGTRNAVAQEFYWEAREMWRRRTPDALRDALQLFRRAVERDPTYAQAYVGLADTYNLLGSFEYGVLPPDSAAAAARAAADRALRLVPEFPPALAARGNVRMNFDREWIAAEEDFRRAIALDPDFADAYEWLALLKMARGQFGAADSMLKNAQRKNPKSPLTYVNVAQLEYIKGNYVQAHLNIKSALAVDSGFSRAHALSALVQSREGRAAEAVAALEVMESYTPEDPLVAGLLGYAYGLAGRRDDALGQLDWLDRLGRKGHYIPRESLAMIHLGLNQFDAAIELLEQAADLHSTGMIYLAVEPMLEPLRAYPRFKELVRRVHQH